MIELTDLTLIESEGNYKVTDVLMREHGPAEWMLRSEVLVSMGKMAFNYLIHFWNDKTACIMGTNHPPVLEVPDHDIRELHEWCVNNGWNLTIHKEILEDQRSFEFWLRVFRTGLINSEEFDKHEKNEIDRLNIVMKSDRMDNNAD